MAVIQACVQYDTDTGVIISAYGAGVVDSAGNYYADAGVFDGSSYFVGDGVLYSASYMGIGDFEAYYYPVPYGDGYTAGSTDGYYAGSYDAYAHFLDEIGGQLPYMTVQASFPDLGLGGVISLDYVLTDAGGNYVQPDPYSYIISGAAYGPSSSINGLYDTSADYDSGVDSGKYAMMLEVAPYCLYEANVANYAGVYGTIDPATVMASNTNGTLSLDDVKTTAGGNLNVDTIAAAAAATQLSADAAAVNSGKADILKIRTILGVQGTFNLTTHDATVSATSAASQLAADVAVVNGFRSHIDKDAGSLLTVTGTLDISQAIASNIKQGASIAGVAGTLVTNYSYPVVAGNSDVELAVGTTSTLTWRAIDGSNNPVDLSGKSVMLTIYRDTIPSPITVLTKTGVVSDTNLVSVAFSPTDTAITQRIRYKLMNTTDNEEIASGLFWVK